MRKTYVWDPDLKKMVPKGQKRPREAGLFIQGDIEPYKVVGGPKAGQWITSRSQHREYMRENGFIEVGNEHRAFFEYGGKTRDNPYASRNPDYRKHDFEGRFKRRP